MWMSMTGYGRAEKTEGELRVSVELKTINHRYQEIILRTARELAPLDDRIRKLLQNCFLRGRMEVFIIMHPVGEAQYQVHVNPELASAYLSGMSQLAKLTGLPQQVTLHEIAALPDVLRVEHPELDLDSTWRILESAIQQSFADLQNMRISEGQRLHADIAEHLHNVEVLCSEIEFDTPRLECEYQQRLIQRFQHVLNSIEIDQTRLLQEVAVWVERTTIAEELVRLKSHCAQFGALLDAEGEAVGRRADFLLQEMNREVNTIGAKANDLLVGQRVIELKSELEKIREQVQNVE